MGVGLHASRARSRILGQQALQLPTGRPFFTNSALQTDSVSGQARDTTVQVGTIGEGFGMGSEFSQTGCAANNSRDHAVLLPWFKGAGD